MAKLDVGDAAPEFTAQAHDGSTVRLSDYVGKSAVVLFFYPLDFSPTCTTEACAFRDAFADFASAGTAVIGISGDSLERHRAFAAQRKLPYLLISDADGAIRRVFGVPKTLGLFPGRVTYVIDKVGVIRHVFSAQFGASQHVKEALQVVERLQRESGK